MLHVHPCDCSWQRRTYPFDPFSENLCLSDEVGWGGVQREVGLGEGGALREVGRCCDVGMSAYSNPRVFVNCLQVSS